MPDISKVSSSEGGKKTKVEGGIVKAGAGKGDEFAEFSFKEGNTAVLKLQEIFVQEKGKDALKKLEAGSEGTSAAPKVKGGKAKGKAASKSAGKAAKAAKKAEGSVAKSVDKVLKYTPNKPSSRKETPQKTVGKSSAAKKSTTGGKKQTPAMPSPGGKQSTKTTDQMTMAQFKKYLQWHEQKKGGKASSGGKVLGKRSTGKASAASKASKRSKK